MLKTDKLYIARYNDYYGKLLTEHQCEMIRLYYDCDISLFEIAEQFGISRQAVRDSIKRAEQALVHYEQALGVYHKQIEICEIVDRLSHSMPSECIEDLDRLKRIMEDNNGDIQ